MGKLIKETNNDFEIGFYKVIWIPLIKKSFDTIIYRKLLIDGYVYCNDGLIPSNKTAFKPLDTNNSPLYRILKDKNPDLVISTHPFSSQMVSYLKKKRKIS